MIDKYGRKFKKFSSFVAIIQLNVIRSKEIKDLDRRLIYFKKIDSQCKVIKIIILIDENS